MTDEEAANWCEDFGRVASTLDGREALRRATSALRVKGMLVRALTEMVCTHGDRCPDSPCDARRRAEAALAEARKEPL